MMKRIAIVLLVLLGSADAFAKVSVLADAPSVRRQNLLRKSRHEITPSFGVTMGDTFTRSFLFQVGYQYHVLDWLGIGAEFGYAASMKTALTEGIEREVARDPEWQAANPGQSYEMPRTGLQMLALAKASFTPLSGKLVLFRKFLGYVDMHVDVGGGMAKVQGLGKAEGATTFAVLVGGGFRFFPTRMLSVNLDVRDYMVPRKLNQPSNGKPAESKLTQNALFLLGVSFFLPTQNEIGL
jgi:outer membrane beta-barrel protein